MAPETLFAPAVCVSHHKAGIVEQNGGAPIDMHMELKGWVGKSRDPSAGCGSTGWGAQSRAAPTPLFLLLRKPFRAELALPVPTLQLTLLFDVLDLIMFLPFYPPLRTLELRSLLIGMLWEAAALPFMLCRDHRVLLLL